MPAQHAQTRQLKAGCHALPQLYITVLLPLCSFPLTAGDCTKDPSMASRCPHSCYNRTPELRQLSNMRSSVCTGRTVLEVRQRLHRNTCRTPSPQHNVSIGTCCGLPQNLCLWVPTKLWVWCCIAWQACFPLLFVIWDYRLFQIIIRYLFCLSVVSPVCRLRL